MGVLDLCILAHLDGNTQPHISETVYVTSLCVCVCLRAQMVKTTGGPALGATVSSPALTNAAVTLLQDSLYEEERQLWTSLGPNWTLPRSVTITGSDSVT